ncbi:unnamed protein product [Pelagomonas calceolata]|uniref:Glutathione transferase n=1 Tax=Pelagomonas calceolata TaxID=35677 RepID=A0A8J2X6D8_9STRA|nr:unnamed protein product [Pelagomonas calceolata]|mmetsp:Transcript_9362/g.29091  ORF Transcript_9362/g.29091 Transcript_9362/m.29091 type:complete len:574 (-) Transcript_9362:9-1730(-)
MKQVAAAAAAALAYHWWASRRKRTAKERREAALEKRFEAKAGLTLYGNVASPCTRRVLIHLKLHGVSYKFVEVNLLRGEQRSEAYKKINPLCKVPALRHDDLILYESGAISYYIDSKFGPQNEPLETPWLDWELSLADAFSRLSRQYVDAHIVRSLHARPHFVQDLPEGPFAAKWTRIFDGTFCEGIEAEACLERVAAHLSELEGALADGRAFLGGAEFSAADAAVLPRLLKCPQNHFLRTPLQEERFGNIIAYVERCLALPVLDAGAAQTRLFWRPNVVGRFVVPVLEAWGNVRNAAYSTVHRASATAVDAAVARTPKFTARPSTTARTLVVDAAAATCFAVRIAARELGDNVTVLTLDAPSLERLAPTPDALAACGALAGGCARLPLLLGGGEAVAGALAVATQLSNGRLGDSLDAAVSIKRWMHWARSVDGDVLQRLYALYVGPRRLLERGGIEYALAPLPPVERTLALERCRDCNAPLDTALTAELAAALATVEETLANGDLAPGFPSLADAFAFPIVECAHACGAAPLSGSVAAAPRPATLAWRASLLEREAFAEVGAEIGRLWGVDS